MKFKQKDVDLVLKKFQKKNYEYKSVKSLRMLVLLAFTLCIMLAGCAKGNLVAEHMTINGTPAPNAGKAPTLTPSEPPTLTPAPTFTPTPTEEPLPDDATPTPTASGIVEGTPAPATPTPEEPTPTEAESPSASPTPTAFETATPTPTEAPATPTPTEAPATPTPTETPATPTPTTAPVQSGYYSRSGRTDIPTFVGLSYIVTDGNGAEIISYNRDKQIYPASTVKMLTAMVAIEYLNLSTPLTVTSEIKGMIPTDEWNYGVVEGQTFPLEVWLHMLLMESCGDAAFVIAANAGAVIAGGNGLGALDAFVEEMNAMAKSCGANATHVDNPVGLDKGNGYTDIYSTASDMAKICVKFMKNDALAAIVANKEYTVPDCTLADGTVVKGRKLMTSNYYYAEPEKYKSDLFTAIGTKSGATDAAGLCYVATVVEKGTGRKLICACFGIGSEELGDKGYTRETMFNEMTKIFEYCILNEP